MTAASPAGGELEPFPRLYALLARGRLFRRFYRLVLADLAEGLPHGARLLDVGAGPGYLLDYLAALRPDLELWGVDLDWRMLSYGRRRISRLTSSPWPRIAARAQALPCKGGVFERVIATMSLHHWRQPALGVAEILRVLKPGGRAWLYEVHREATLADLRRFATQEKLFFPLVFLAFKVLSPGHALEAGGFARVCREAGAGQWRLKTAHHVFLRAEIEG